MKQESDCAQEIKTLREEMGMNRRQFCEYFEIPYRTVTDWEGGKRSAPDYLLRLLKYKAAMDGFVQKK